MSRETSSFMVKAGLALMAFVSVASAEAAEDGTRFYKKKPMTPEEQSLKDYHDKYGYQDLTNAPRYPTPDIDTLLRESEEELKKPPHQPSPEEKQKLQKDLDDLLRKTGAVPAPAPLP